MKLTYRVEISEEIIQGIDVLHELLDGTVDAEGFPVLKSSLESEYEISEKDYEEESQC